MHGGNKPKPKVLQGGMVFNLHKVLPKASIQCHQLMDEVRHLHKLEVIFKGAITFPGVLVLHAIASIFERIEAFILDFPAQTPGPTGIGNIAGVDG